MTSSHQCFTNASPMLHQCFTNASPMLHHLQPLKYLEIFKFHWLFVGVFCPEVCLKHRLAPLEPLPRLLNRWLHGRYGFVDLQMTFTTQKQRSEGQNRKVRAPELLLCHLHWLLQFLRFLCPFSSFSFSSWPQHRHLPRPPRRGHHRSRLRPLGPPPPRPPRPQPLQPSRKGWHRMTGIMFEAQKNPWWMGWFMNYSTCQEIPEVYHTNDLGWAIIEQSYRWGYNWMALVTLVVLVCSQRGTDLQLSAADLRVGLEW